MADAKERLIQAGEHLFARNGVHATRVRELNAMADQRNSSALHYHFGSREGLLQAIVERHSGPVDAERMDRLKALREPVSLRDLVAIILVPLAEELASSSGRDYLRIVPQSLETPVAPAAIKAAFERAEGELSWLAPATRRERLGAMFLAGSTLLAARAERIEDGRDITLSHRQFVDNLIDMMSGLVTAPTGAPVRRTLSGQHVS